MAEADNIDDLILLYPKTPEREKRTIETRVCEVFTPLVQKIAAKYEFPSFSSAAGHEDRIQDGYQGLLKALRTYDPERNTKFLTYAFSCVRKTIYSGVRDITTNGGSKSYSNSKLQKYRKIKMDLTMKLGRIPSVGELSSETGWRISTVLAYERLFCDTVSIEDTELLDINM